MATIPLDESGDDCSMNVIDNGSMVYIEDRCGDVSFNKQQATRLRDALTRWLETGTVAEDSRTPNPACHECGGDGVCGKPCDVCWKGGA